jgi:hemoglobin-like flavoprotein
LDRVLAHPGFIDLFYKRFFEAHPDIAALFSHTDMNKQKRKLASSLKLMTEFNDNDPGSDLYIGYLGRLHAGYRIPSTMYQIWLDSLVNAVSLCDPEFTESLESTWRSVMQQGIDAMTAAGNS